jgi:hypothetical protein
LIQKSDHHPNLFFIPSDHTEMIKAARDLPALMANETRLQRTLAALQNDFAYIIIDTPPTTGDLLINALVAADQVLIPVETSYLGVSGLIELQRTIDQVKAHFRPDLKILGTCPPCVKNSVPKHRKSWPTLSGVSQGCYSRPSTRPLTWPMPIPATWMSSPTGLPGRAPAKASRPARVPHTNMPIWWIWY